MKFRAFYKPDFEEEDGPLQFSQKEIDGELFFVMDADPEYAYDFSIPFVDLDWIVQREVGIQDKFGKDIFEGDIVSVIKNENLFIIKYGKVNRHVLSYHDTDEVISVEINCFYFESLKDKKAYFSITNNGWEKHDLDDTIVVGNIFNNKDLLKHDQKIS